MTVWVTRWLAGELTPARSVAGGPGDARFGMVSPPGRPGAEDAGDGARVLGAPVPSGGPRR